MTQLKDYQNVGVFVLIPAPLNPIKAFDAEQFKRDIRTLMDSYPDIKFLAVNLCGIDFVYSDAFNAFAMCQQELGSKGGQFAVLADNETLIMTFKRAGLDRVFKIFVSESEMLAFSNGNAPVVNVVERVTQRMAAVVSEYKPVDDDEVPPVVNRVAQAQNADFVPRFAADRKKMETAVPRPPKPMETEAAPAAPKSVDKPLPEQPKQAIDDNEKDVAKPTNVSVTDAAAAYSAFAEEPSSTGKIVAILVVVGIIIGVIAYIVL